MLYTELTLKMITLMWITVMLFNQTDSAQINDLNQPNPVIAAGVGENVTLHCFQKREDNSITIIWFKQKVGQVPQVMVTVQHEPKYKDEFKPPKFSIEKEEKTGFHLKIMNVEPSDEALYYCGLLYFCGLSASFGKGTFLSVKAERSAVDPVVICLAGALGVCVVVIFALIFIITCKGRNRMKLKQGSVTDKTPNQDCDTAELNYAALYFSERRAKRGRVKKQQPQDIIYSDVQNPSKT